jgi:sRNA-binding carbon storage regulator CsrA
MLALARKPGQSLVIEPDPALDPQTTVGELFRGGAITITVIQVSGSVVKLGIDADRRLVVLRDELVGNL